MKIIKLTTSHDFGERKRQDINDLISALVRIGYEVWKMDNYVCFKFGNDDIIVDNDA